MSKNQNSKINTTKKKSVPWKKKTGLQKGAVITNWLSMALLVCWFIGLILLLFHVLPTIITPTVVWGCLLAAAVIGFAWFFFVIIMINVFGKR